MKLTRWLAWGMVPATLIATGNCSSKVAADAGATSGKSAAASTSSAGGMTAASSSSSKASSGAGGATTASGTGGAGGSMMMGKGTCMSPIVIAPMSTTMGDTTGLTGSLDGSCYYVGPGAAEIVYKLTANADGVLHAKLDAVADLMMYARKTCDGAKTELKCADNVGGGQTEEMYVSVAKGDVVYPIVDGSGPQESGPFTLVTEILLETSCTDMIDNNNDGLVDCEDPGCFKDVACDFAKACGAAKALTMSLMGDTTNAKNQFKGSCETGGAPESLFSYTPKADTQLELLLTSTADLGMYARSTCADPKSEIGCADNHVAYPEYLLLDVKKGMPYTIFVDGYQSGAAGAFGMTWYELVPNEVEGNDTFDKANVYMPNALGVLADAMDVDWYKVTVPGAGGTITAAVSGVNPAACGGAALDSYLEIYDTDGSTKLASNDDIDAPNDNLCSATQAVVGKGGTYYVAVSQSMSAVGYRFAYLLGVKVQ